MKWATLEPGYGIVHRSVLRDKKLTRGAKLVYALLASYSNHEGKAYPSQATMAKDLCSTEKPVREWLEELVQREMIERVLVGMPAHNVYTVRYPVREPTPVQSGTVLPDKTGTVLPAKKTIVKENKSLPHIRAATDYYQSKYLAEFGVKPTWDGKIIKLLMADLSRLGETMWRSLVDLFFSKRIDFVEKNDTGKGYNIFHSMIDKLVAIKAKEKPRSTGPAFDLEEYEKTGKLRRKA